MFNTVFKYCVVFHACKYCINSILYSSILFFVPIFMWFLYVTMLQFSSL